MHESEDNRKPEFCFLQYTHEEANDRKTEGMSSFDHFSSQRMIENAGKSALSIISAMILDEDQDLKPFSMNKTEEMYRK